MSQPRGRQLSPPPPSNDIPPSVMAISNLRCPSPPPILKNGSKRNLLSPSLLPSLCLSDDHPDIDTQLKQLRLNDATPSSCASSPKIGIRETISAGGAFLKDKARPDESGVSRDSLVSSQPQTFPDIVSPTSNNPLVDHLANPPMVSSHHKSPLVHAHFFVDETFKSKLTSRSGSLIAADTPFASQPPSQSNPAKAAAPSSETSQAPGSISVEQSVSPTDANQPSSSLQSKLALNQPLDPLYVHPVEQNANIDPRLPQDDDRIHVLFGVCGALSTIKIKLIINKLYEIYTPQKICIQLILTQSSAHFISPETLAYLENVKKVRVWRDSDEWTTWRTRLDPVLHIELRRWADILIVCPLTANTLAKISMGMCDNLLTNVIRAWNTSYPILLAPSMVSHAYNSVTTKRQLKLIALEMHWVEILKPVEKIVGSYGDIGMGGMMDWNEIVNRVVIKLGGYPEEDDAADDGNEDEEAIADDDDDGDNDDENDDDDDDDDEDDDDDDDDDEDDDEDGNASGTGINNLSPASNEITPTVSITSP